MRCGLSSTLGCVAPPGVAELKEEELLEDQPPLRRRAEGVQLLDARLVRPESARASSAGRRGHQAAGACAAPPAADRAVSARQLVERLPHQPALHVRRHGAGLLVERHDASDVAAPPESSRHELELGVQEVQPGRVELHVAEDRPPARAAGGCRRGTPGSSTCSGWRRSRRRARRGRCWKPRRRVTARLALLISPSTAALLPGPQRGDRLHAAAVLVAERQPVEQIFDGDEAGALEVGGLARTDAFQELERRGERTSRRTVDWRPTERRPSARGRRRSAGCWRAASNGSSRRIAVGMLRRRRVVRTAVPGAASSARGTPDTLGRLQLELAACRPACAACRSP